jgi:hypothetical protein
MVSIHHSSLVSFEVEFHRSFVLGMVELVGEIEVVHLLILILFTFIPFLPFIIAFLVVPAQQLLEQLKPQHPLFLVFISTSQQRPRLLCRLLLAFPSFSLAFLLLMEATAMLELPQPVHKQQEFTTLLQLYQRPS